MLIYLIGMMGSGKSTVGKYLSMLMSCPYLDSDILLAQWKDRSISDIFKTEGEENFREYERQLLNAVAEYNFKKQNLIFSSGGGMPCFHDNIHTMLQSGKVFYLKQDAETLFNRLKNNSEERPLMKDMTFKDFEELIAEREKVYMKADHLIETNSVEASANAIKQSCT